MYTNPKRIFNLPDQEDTYIVVDLDEKWTIPPAMAYSKCRWTPFAGMQMQVKNNKQHISLCSLTTNIIYLIFSLWPVVQGLVSRVVLRGETAMLDGKVYAKPGSGKNVCEHAVPAADRTVPKKTDAQKPAVAASPAPVVPSAKTISPGVASPAIEEVSTDGMDLIWTP